METDFKVKVGEFEGPLELLLELVEKRKLHISEVTLKDVADEFIEHVRSLDKFPMNDSADFILIASTLLLIKSKSLLPNLPLTVEEEENIHDLENRLELYKRYKELGRGIEKMLGNPLYFANESKEIKSVFSPTAEITISSIKNALLTALQNIPKQAENLPKVVVTKIISLEEMIDKLRDRIEGNLRTSFKDFSGIGKVEKVNVIVSFLAMLELVKQGFVNVSQSEHFRDIEIESDSIGVPRY